jgi:glycolate oxidase iron-sulfur subunit
MKEEGESNKFRGIDVPSIEVLNNCIHCGLCLPTCPTYALTNLERSSPRGRIRLIKSVVEGKLPISDGFIDEMNLCLDCQACETSCPAGIKFGSLVEAARAQIYQGKYGSKIGWYIKKILLSWIFVRHGRLKFLARILRWYQMSVLQNFFLKSGLLKLISKKLYTMQLLAPKISKTFSSDILAEIILPKIKVQNTVAFLPGCIMDVAFSNVNDDTVKLLLHHGCKVIIPRGLGCCGSLQSHNGDMIGARVTAKKNIELLSTFSFEYIVTNSAGCGAFMKEYGELFSHDLFMKEKAKNIAKRTRDLTEFLVETGFLYNQNKFSSVYVTKRITYHDACHLIHSQKISEQPRELIRSVPKLKFVELPESAWCCGSAGIYNITQHDVSMQLLKKKIENIRKIDPDIIVMGNPGCMLQLQYGLRKEGLEIEVLHIATFLRRACET